MIVGCTIIGFVPLRGCKGYRREYECARDEQGDEAFEGRSVTIHVLMRLPTGYKGDWAGFKIWPCDTWILASARVRGSRADLGA